MKAIVHHESGGVGTFAVQIAKAFDAEVTNFTVTLNSEDLQFLTELIETGKVTPVIDRTYSLSEIPGAIRYVQADTPEEGRRHGLSAVLEHEAVLGEPQDAEPRPVLIAPFSDVLLSTGPSGWESLRRGAGDLDHAGLGRSRGGDRAVCR